jgi:hypothetical protein
MTRTTFDQRAELMPRSFWRQIVTYAGILGMAITILSNLQGLVALADWARYVVVHWSELMRFIWGTLFDWIRLPVPRGLYGPLTFLIFAVATATRLRVREAFEIKPLDFEPYRLETGRFNVRGQDCLQADIAYKQLPPRRKATRIITQFALFLVVCLAFSWNAFGADALGPVNATLVVVGSALLAIVITMTIRNAFLPDTVFWWSASITDALLKTIGVVVVLVALNELSKLGLEKLLVAPKIAG